VAGLMRFIVKEQMCNQKPVAYGGMNHGLYDECFVKVVEASASMESHSLLPARCHEGIPCPNTKVPHAPKVRIYSRREANVAYDVINEASHRCASLAQKSNLELGAAKPSAPSCEGSGEEAPGIEPVHPSCGGVLIPVHRFIPLDHGAF
jgi:hypothetical protein